VHQVISRSATAQGFRCGNLVFDITGNDFDPRIAGKGSVAELPWTTGEATDSVASIQEPRDQSATDVASCAGHCDEVPEGFDWDGHLVSSVYWVPYRRAQWGRKRANRGDSWEITEQMQICDAGPGDRIQIDEPNEECHMSEITQEAWDADDLVVQGLTSRRFADAVGTEPTLLIFLRHLG
jgi:hypothetical protein